MKIKHLVPFGLALLLLNACIAPGTSATLVGTTTTAQEQTPQSIVSTTPVADTATAPLATPKPIATADALRLPLPDVVLNIGSWGAYPLYECREHALPGQILISQFPYANFTTLAYDPGSSSYTPMWSPNGEWIAYVKVKDQKPIVTVPYDQPIWDYPESDSIWIMRPDGSEKRQLSDWFPRSEAISLHSSGPACDVVGGILSLEGWSTDNQWISFMHRPGNREGATLYALNTATRESRVIATGVTATQWAPNSNDLALINEQAGATPMLKIAHLDTASSTPVTYAFTEELSRLMPIAIQWTRDGTGIFVVVANTNSYPFQEDIWRLNTITEQWGRVLRVVIGDVDFGGNRAVGFDSPQTRIAICGREYLGFQNLSSAKITGKIDLPGFVNCRLVNYLNGATGSELLSFVSLDGRTLWVSSIQGGKALKVLNLDELQLPDNYELSAIAWQH